MDSALKSEKIDIDAIGPSKIVYYCRDCKRIVKGVSHKGRKKYTFRCPLCDSGVIAYGTQQSIVNFYRIKPMFLEEWAAEDPQLVSLEALKQEEKSEK